MGLRFPAGRASGPGRPGDRLFSLIRRSSGPRHCARGRVAPAGLSGRPDADVFSGFVGPVGFLSPAGLASGPGQPGDRLTFPLRRSPVPGFVPGAGWHRLASWARRKRTYCQARVLILRPTGYVACVPPADRGWIAPWPPSSFKGWVWAAPTPYLGATIRRWPRTRVPWPPSPFRDGFGRPQPVPRCDHTRLGGTNAAPTINLRWGVGRMRSTRVSLTCRPGWFIRQVAGGGSRCGTFSNRCRSPHTIALRCLGAVTL